MKQELSNVRVFCCLSFTSMSARSRLVIPPNGQRIPANRNLFPMTVYLLPETANRLNRFNSGASNINIFNENDRLEFIVTPGRAAMELDLQAIYSRVIQQVSDYFPVDITEIPGELQFDLISDPDNAEYGENILGGNSMVVIPLRDAYEVLPRLMDILVERNYKNVISEMIRFTIRLNLRFLLAELSRGGCAQRVYFDPRTGNEKACPLPLKDDAGKVLYLHTYSSWPPVKKQIFGKRYRDAMPSHLRALRGLWCYSFSRDIIPVIQRTPSLQQEPVYRVCALMAFLYGWQRCLFSLGEVTEDSLLLNDVGALYYTAVGHTKRFGFDVGNLFTNQSFKKILDDLCPGFAVSVLDHSRAVTFKAEGRDYVNPLPHGGFSRGQFTEALMHEYWKRRICLYFDYQKNHYIPIFDIDLFFAYSAGRKYCPFCSTLVERRRLSQHQCRLISCYRCDQKFQSQELLEAHRRKPEDQHEDTFDCNRCGQSFINRDCFNYHLMSCTGIYLEECFHCKKRYKVTEQHYCREGQCFRCHTRGYEHRKMIALDGSRYDALHSNCYFSRSKLPKKSHLTDTWMFDFECMLEKGVYSCLTGFQPKDVICNGDRLDTSDKQLIVHRHTVNYAYAMPMILGGRFIPIEEARSYAIEATTIDAFWHKLKSVKLSGHTQFYAHNLKGYDGRLIMDFFERCNIVPQLLLKTGDKLMMFNVSVDFPGQDKKHWITFKDTLLQLQTSLKNLPKMFGLDVSIRKGDFPYEFNTRDNQAYEGMIPDIKYYNIERKRGAEKERFLMWHDEEKARIERTGEKWCLQTELREYCKNDVEVLQIAFGTYCRTMAELNQGLLPCSTVTTASYAYKIYTTLHMPEKTICRLNYDQDLFARMAMHGGKTDVRIMQVELDESVIASGIGMRYVDVQSLYPTVQYYDPLPVGSPKTYIYDQRNPFSQEEFQRLLHLPDDQHVYFIECDIHPTRYVHHPIVGDYDKDKKFVSHLQPLKKVVLTSVEFKEAIRQGYCATKIYRVDMYQSSRELFKTYIETFLRLKITASKSPFSENTTDAEKQRYFDRIEEKYNFRLTENDFEENASQRSLAKLLLNSLWGKFGERQNRSETKIFIDAKEKQKFSQRVHRGKYKIVSERSYGTYGWQVLYKEPMKKNYPEKNVAIASFVTAHARIRLLKGLNTVGDRVVYHDTDSVVYIQQPGKPGIEEGQFLGDWESETGNSLIDIFIGLAPKTYAYAYTTETGERKYVTKAKGFPTDGITERKLTLDHFRQILYSTLVPGEDIPQFISRKLSEERVVNLRRDVDENGRISFNVLNFAHNYPNIEKVLENADRMLEEGSMTLDEIENYLNEALRPLITTSQQRKALKVDYQKGIINKANITERYNLDPHRNIIRFETLPFGWNEGVLSNDPVSQRPFEECSTCEEHDRPENAQEGFFQVQEMVEQNEKYTHYYV